LAICLQKGSSEDERKVAKEKREISTIPKIFLGNIASLIRNFFHIIKDEAFSQDKEEPIKLIGQPADFP
jgi:hypothetical protein